MLNGTKTFITQGSVAGTYVILAVTDPAKKQKGITAFIIERGTPGFRAGRKLEKMGLHASDTAELILEDVRVPDSQRLGPVDRGFIDTLRILDKGRITIAAMALGLGQGAYEAALRYARERKQFGRPIADFQAIQNMLAQSAMELVRFHGFSLSWRAGPQLLVGAVLLPALSPRLGGRRRSQIAKVPSCMPDSMTVGTAG